MKISTVRESNVLLSAAVGGRAKAVSEHSSVVEVLTAEATLAEIQEYSVHTKHKMAR